MRAGEEEGGGEGGIEKRRTRAQASKWLMTAVKQDDEQEAGSRKRKTVGFQLQFHTSSVSSKAAQRRERETRGNGTKRDPRTSLKKKSRRRSTHCYWNHVIVAPLSFSSSLRCLAATPFHQEWVSGGPPLGGNVAEYSLFSLFSADKEWDWGHYQMFFLLKLFLLLLG